MRALALNFALSPEFETPQEYMHMYTYDKLTKPKSIKKQGKIYMTAACQINLQTFHRKSEKYIVRSS